MSKIRIQVHGGVMSCDFGELEPNELFSLEPGGLVPYVTLSEVVNFVRYDEPTRTKSDHVANSFCLESGELVYYEDREQIWRLHGSLTIYPFNPDGVSND